MKFFLWMFTEMSSFLLGFCGMESLNKSWSLHIKPCLMPQILEYCLLCQDFTEVVEFMGYVRETKMFLYRDSFCILPHQLYNFSKVENGESTWGGSRACHLLNRLWAEFGHACYWHAASEIQVCSVIKYSLLPTRYLDKHICSLRCKMLK